MTYYVLRDKNTGLYWRGKGQNRWGKYFNQASVYRVKGQVENTVEDLTHRGIHVEIVPIQIVESTVEVAPVRHGKWVKATPYSQEYCDQCGLTPKTIFGKLPPYFPHCGAKMESGESI